MYDTPEDLIPKKLESWPYSHQLTIPLVQPTKTTMHLHTLATSFLLLVSNAIAVPTQELGKRQTTAKYCNATSSICYLQYSTTASNPVFRIAIPDGASAPFAVLLQIIAPVSLGWAGFAWGGGMTLNPLTVAWPNGNKAIVSSRWST